MIELAVLDVAGTTIDEKGTVYRVLADTVRAAGGDPTAAAIQQWMGAGKREAIAALLDLDAATAVVGTAFEDFRARLTAAYRADPPVPFDGVREVLDALRASGVKVVLTTGFDRGVTSSLLDSIGWDASVLDAVVCIDDVPAGRPKPYMIFRAMETAGVGDVRAVLVAGDTPRDIEAGRNAGAGVVVGVCTGDVDAQTLQRSGPTEVLDGVVDIPGLLARQGQPIQPAVHSGSSGAGR